MGAVNTKRPGMMDFVGRAKWDAWNSLGNMTQEDAQKNYIAFVNSLAGAEVSLQAGGKEGLCVVESDGVRKQKTDEYGDGKW